MEPGIVNEVSWVVEERHLASTLGSGLAAVFATPMLVALCEDAASQGVAPHLAAGQQTVGTWIGIRHLAATPPGMRVTARARLVEVDRRRLRFEFEAWDEVEKIGEGEHERFIIDAATFEARIAEKARQVKS
ncbi:MAG: thioesterase family protein [Ardenticatenaceae bacterium]|nr:thioesterase family protein [Ardenticatenaceae bacterium]